MYPNFVKGVMYFFVRFLSFYEQIGPLFSPQSLLLLFCFQTYLWKRAPSLLLAVWASSSRPRSLGRAHGARAASSHCRTLLQSHTHLLHFAFPGNTPAATSFVFFLILWDICLESELAGTFTWPPCFHPVALRNRLGASRCQTPRHSNLDILSNHSTSEHATSDVCFQTCPKATASHKKFRFSLIIYNSSL